MPAAVAVTWLGGWPFAAMVAAAALLMLDEWRRITGCLAAMPALAAAAAGIVAALIAAQAEWAGLGVLALLSGAAGAAALAQRGGGAATWAGLGVLYLGVPALAMVWLRQSPEIGRAGILWLLAVVWATDIGAYYGGRTFGGPKLAPGISPNKTWSGLVSGIAAAGAAGFAAALLAGWRPLTLALVSAVLAVAEQAGDLTESAIKRRFGVKDSGSIIPGHGGVLDRLDGTLAVAAAVGAMAVFGWEMPAWR